MRNASVWYGALGAVLALSTACSEVTPPTAPSPTAEQIPAPAPTPPATHIPTFPAISGPARIYVGVSSTSYPMHGSPLASRYVLYDDGRFALQYSSANYPFFEYRGTYSGGNGHIDFHWEGWSTAGPWGATGTLTEDSLSVEYNFIMQMSDFEDGVYVRQR
jgi:hypothetical protein